MSGPDGRQRPTRPREERRSRQDYRTGSYHTEARRSTRSSAVARPRTASRRRSPTSTAATAGPRPAARAATGAPREIAARRRGLADPITTGRVRLLRLQPLPRVVAEEPHLQDRRVHEPSTSRRGIDHPLHEHPATHE